MCVSNTEHLISVRPFVILVNDELIFVLLSVFFVPCPLCCCLSLSTHFKQTLSLCPCHKYLPEPRLSIPVSMQFIKVKQDFLRQKSDAPFLSTQSDGWSVFEPANRYLQIPNHLV